MTTFTTPTPEIPRDRWGRPLVVPPTGGKAIPYTRCTTYVSAVEDTYNLSRWQQRMVALGLSDRRDLQLAVAAHREDKEKINAICEQALEAAKGHAAATTGTALHAITETHDRGQEVGSLPEEAQADLNAYVDATSDLTATMIEQFMVMDSLKIGGTPDRVVKYRGRRYIADLKTGSIDYGYLKIAAQLAVYSRCHPYDVGTSTRMQPHGAEVDRGIVIHLPAGTGTCRLYWVDLLAGWEIVKLARDLRAKRALKFASLFQRLEPVPTADEALAFEVDPGPVTGGPLTLADQIKACTTSDGVRDLWRANASEWDDHLTALAKAHIESLAGTTTSTTTEGAPA